MAFEKEFKGIRSKHIVEQLPFYIRMESRNVKVPDTQLVASRVDFYSTNIQRLHLPHVFDGDLKYRIWRNPFVPVFTLLPWGDTYIQFEVGFRWDPEDFDLFDIHFLL